MSKLFPTLGGRDLQAEARAALKADPRHDLIDLGAVRAQGSLMCCALLLLVAVTAIVTSRDD